MSAKFAILFSGIIWNGGKSNEYDDLNSTLVKVFDQIYEMKKQKIKKLSIPAMFYRLFGWPVREFSQLFFKFCLE